MNPPTATSSTFFSALQDRLSHPKDCYEFQLSGSCVRYYVRCIHSFNWNGYVYWPAKHCDASRPCSEINRLYDVCNGISYIDGKQMGFSTVTDNDYCLLREVVSRRSESNK